MQASVQSGLVETASTCAGAVAATRVTAATVTGVGAAVRWRAAVYGKLGHGDLERQLLPKKVEAFAGRRVVAVSAGARLGFTSAAAAAG